MGSDEMKTDEYFKTLGKAIYELAKENKPIINIKQYAGDRFGNDIYIQEWELDKIVEKYEDRFKDNIPYKEVVDYLNEKTGRNFKHTTKSTQTCIRARFNDGFELDDFKKVVYKKSKDWLGSKYEKYLRTETLFKSKFDSYLQDAKASESEVDWEDLV